MYEFFFFKHMLNGADPDVFLSLPLRDMDTYLKFRADRKGSMQRGKSTLPRHIEPGTTNESQSLI